MKNDGRFFFCQRQLRKYKKEFRSSKKIYKDKDAEEEEKKEKKMRTVDNKQ